jgi:hypothetical protein
LSLDEYHVVFAQERLSSNEVTLVSESQCLLSPMGRLIVMVLDSRLDREWGKTPVGLDYIGGALTQPKGITIWTDSHAPVREGGVPGLRMTGEYGTSKAR